VNAQVDDLITTGGAALGPGLHRTNVLELHDRGVVALPETSVALPPIGRSHPDPRRTSHGAISHGHTLRSCWAVHPAVGCALTFMWTMRRRSCDSRTNTNKTRNVAVGSLKKSINAS
jgi:hypothetical protein